MSNIRCIGDRRRLWKRVELLRESAQTEGVGGCNVFILDRFEGAWAIIETENRQMFNLPRFVLPPGTKEGDVLSIQVGIDVVATKERAEKAKRMLDNLFDE